MNKEKWKTINNFKNVKDEIYQVSSYGRVRIKSNGTIIKRKVANKNKHPYYAVYLKHKNEKSEWVLVHQLVAWAFVKIPDYYNELDDLVPDHLDNNGLNNYYKNLEWKTRGENVKSAHEKGFINNSCENNANAIVTDIEVHTICKYLEIGLSYDEIISRMNFPNNNIYRHLLIRIKNKNAWAEISSKYNFNSNVTKYTAKQMETIKNLPLIRQFISEGFSNYEIIRKVYGQLSTSQMKSKNETISKIRKNELFKEIP